MRDLSAHYACQRKLKGDRQKMLTECLPFLRRKCQQAKARTIKLISITMDVVRILLDMVPEVNIIHVIRDPRAVIDSQIASGLIDKRKIEKHTKDLCNEMTHNHHVLSTDLQPFRDSIKVVIYEELASWPIEIFREMYYFAGLQFTSKVQSFINSIALAKGHSSKCLWCSSKGDSKLASQNWRKRISQDYLLTIQKICGDALKAYGYRLIYDKKTLLNMAISNRENKSIKLFKH